MRIEKVRLNNVKSYDEETVELEPGVNAILGENGAGKSTIIEAIGFALFDYLPYRKQEDFVRRGETNGTVEVTLSLNGEQYRVVRKCSSSTYYVARDGTREVEGHRDVVDWARTEFGGTDLDDLFSQVVGVPQGTFTAAFSETEANRKKLFQPLLGVDEYSRAHRSLLEPLNHLKDRLVDLGKKESRLDERASGRNDIRTRITETEEKLRDATEQLERLQETIQTLRGEKKNLEEKKDAVAKREQKLADARNELKSQQSLLRSAEEALKEAEEAAERAKELKKPAKRHDELEKELQELEKRADRQRQITEKLAKARGKRNSLKDRIDDLQDTVEQGVEAKEKIPALEEKVEDLDQVENQLKTLRAQGETLKERLTTLKKRRETVEEGEQCPLLEDTTCPEVDSLDTYFENRIEEARDELKQVRREFEETKEEAADLDDSRASLERIRNRVEKGNEAKTALTESQARLQNIEDEIETLENDLDESLLERIKEKREKKKTLVDRKQRYIRLTGTAEKKPEREKKVKVLQKEVKEAEENTQKSGDLLKEAREAFDPERYGDVADELEEAVKKHSGAQSTLESLTERLDENRKELSRKQEVAQELKEVRKKITETDELKETLQTVRRTIRDAAPYVSRELVKHVEAEADEIFSSIMGDATQRLGWDDTYLVTVRESGREKEFNQLSGGEQMAAALSVRLALTRLLSRAGVVFLDEPTQNMDAERRRWLAEKIVDIEGFDQILVVSHDDAFDSLTENVLRVTKDASSTVQEGGL